ncbi:acyltransferase family protein [Massilia litorea]|uniref:Acyltransferase n=1 Tax=Massilia litorea TaxID=2769491 RepID=A0A7L9U9L9_9BURK|nr:acyltransferase [Massilia litorea]QOL51743.1 acyltransferase [Massilia litorea]
MMTSTSPSPNLDVLRSLAVSFVVISHLLLDNSLANPGGFDTHILGTLGVMIFFVHTCLVLMFSLDRQTRVLGGPPTTISFLVVRAFRIYPLSIVVVVVLSVIERMHSGTQPNLSTFLSNVFLIQNLTGSANVTPVLWSLPYEFQMYFFLPVLFIWSRYSGRYSSGGIAALWCASVALVLAFWRLGIDFSLVKFFPCFLPGVLAFCRRRMPRSYSPGVLFAYVGAVAILYPSLVGHGANATVLSWLICLLLGMLIPRCGEIKSNLIRNVGSVIARYSYGIYLVHDPIRYFSFHYLKGISPFVQWSVFVVAVAGLSYFAYHFIEKPCIDLGRAAVNRFNFNRTRTAPDL